jgi:ABC-2 type transport system ATP-binding protein
MTAISIQRAVKSYSRQRVLNEVNLEVPKGVVYALLGENGAGKSTLIRSIMGYQSLDAGTIEVCGLNPFNETLELRRRIGYVSDAPALYDWMTVVQVGWYASAFYPDGFLAEYDRLAQGFGLPPKTKIRDLSKGMRAKVALALAMAFTPELLVLDEPTSGLDPLVRRAFLESMIDRAAAGQTVFLSSHQIHEVERVADWVAILHDGKIQVAAPLDEIKEQVSLVSYSVHDTLLADPAALAAVDVLSREQNGRTISLLVKGCDEQILDGLHTDANLFDVKRIRPNLEELYVGFTQGHLHVSENSGETAIRGEVA